MEIGQKLDNLADALGIDFLGLADMGPALDFIRDMGGEAIAAFPRAISLGMILPHAIVDQLPNRADKAVAMSYESHAYNIVNQRLNLAASQISGLLQRMGHGALPISATDHHDDARLWPTLSHKLAANLAGLGWIGKSCLLVTPKVGPRVRWSTVLTDAPLQTASEQTPEQCGECRECVDICPPGAFTGRAFDPREPREARYDAHKCQDYFRGLVQADHLPVCGLCLYVCPFGRK